MGKKKGGVRMKQVGGKMPAGMPNLQDALTIPPEEQLHLPPPPDRSYQVYWPIHETFTMDTKSFQVIYPSYLDANKTVKQGRRLGVQKSVANPTVVDLSQGLQSMQIRHVLQPYKGYSRDMTCQWNNPGRVLVDVSNFKKKELLLELAQRLDDLPERQARVEREEAERKVNEEKAAAEAAVAAAAVAQKAASAAAASGKKKGKKGKKK